MRHLTNGPVAGRRPLHLEADQAPGGGGVGADGEETWRTKAAHRGRRFSQYNKDRKESCGFGCTAGWKLADQCGQPTER